MASKDGWIKMHRKTLYCESVMRNAFSLGVWTYILLKASHKDMETTFGTQKITIHPGQFVSAYRKMADDLKCNKNEIYRQLKRYENATMIETQSCSKGVLISVLNWDLYQTSETENETELQRISNGNETDLYPNKNIKNKRKKEIYIKADETPVFIELPLNDGSTHSVTEKVVCELKELYPSADVEQELRNMKGWLNGNPTKRKTKTGINRFINSWLAREQNKGGKVTPVKKSNSFAEINKPGFDESALEKMLGV